MSHTLKSTAGVAVAIGLSIGAIGFSNAQVQTEKRAVPAAQRAWKASDLIGQSVYTTRDEEKGKIKDLMIGADGKIVYAAVSFGGFLGIGDKLFAVPTDAIHITWKDNKVEKARVDVTEETIKQRQGFDNDHWPQQADTGFVVHTANR